MAQSTPTYDAVNHLPELFLKQYATETELQNGFYQKHPLTVIERLISEMEAGDKALGKLVEKYEEKPFKWTSQQPAIELAKDLEHYVELAESVLKLGDAMYGHTYNYARNFPEAEDRMEYIGLFRRIGPCVGNINLFLDCLQTIGAEQLDTALERSVLDPDRQQYLRNQLQYTRASDPELIKEDDVLSLAVTERIHDISGIHKGEPIGFNDIYTPTTFQPPKDGSIHYDAAKALEKDEQPLLDLLLKRLENLQKQATRTGATSLKEFVLKRHNIPQETEAALVTNTQRLADAHAQFREMVVQDNIDLDAPLDIELPAFLEALSTRIQDTFALSDEQFAAIKAALDNGIDTQRREGKEPSPVFYNGAQIDTASGPVKFGMISVMAEEGAVTTLLLRRIGHEIGHQLQAVMGPDSRLVADFEYNEALQDNLPLLLEGIAEEVMGEMVKDPQAHINMAASNMNYRFVGSLKQLSYMELFQDVCDTFEEAKTAGREPLLTTEQLRQLHIEASARCGIDVPDELAVLGLLGLDRDRFESRYEYPIAQLSGGAIQQAIQEGDRGTIFGAIKQQVERGCLTTHADFLQITTGHSSIADAFSAGADFIQNQFDRFQHNVAEHKALNIRESITTKDMMHDPRKVIIGLAGHTKPAIARLGEHISAQRGDGYDYAQEMMDAASPTASKPLGKQCLQALKDFVTQISPLNINATMRWGMVASLDNQIKKSEGPPLAEQGASTAAQDKTLNLAD